jgi:hypothetical protein
MVPDNYVINPNNKFNMSFFIKIFVVIIILAIFGFNIFNNLGVVTEQIAFITEPIISFFAIIFGKTSKTVIKTTTAGTRGVTEIIDDTVDVVDATITKAANKKYVIPVPIAKKNNSNNIGQDYEVENVNTNPEPDESNSIVQQGNLGKKGYCYVGNWNGFRSCVKVSESDECLSNMIYKSDAICRNPELRT